MRTLPRQPVVYEIDTWVWLDELSRTQGRRPQLGDITSEILDETVPQGVDAVWLMGVWERSPAAVRVARETESFVTSFREALSDYSADDVVGSPYAVRQYEVDSHLGGANALAKVRERLARRNVGLLLDYVPNHVAIDNAWTESNPEYFIEAPADSTFDQDHFVIVDTRPLALGRDPYFAPWPDVVQLNAFSQGVRDATAETLKRISDQCDGVRCDMGMLLINDVFRKTWGDLAGPAPVDEFWPAIIAAVRQHRPGFTFVAEAYWDMESELLKQGFDYCYDKRLYDRLTHENAEAVNAHLQADLSYQRHLIRFLENHDEPRAAASMSRERERAAAVAVAYLPGAKLYHEGQLVGRRIHNPVPLGRRREEPADSELRDFYLQVMAAAARSKPGDDWQTCATQGWPDNQSHNNLLAWTWSSNGARQMVIVNFAGNASQGRVRVPWQHFGDVGCTLTDAFSGTQYQRDGAEMVNSGLYVDMEAWAWYVFAVDGVASDDHVDGSAPSERDAVYASS